MAACGFRVLSGLAQLFEGISARRIEQTIVIVIGLKVRSDERLDHQACQAVGDRSGVEIPHHSGSGIERKIAVENREMTQYARLRFRQQLIAPIEGRKQGLVPRQRRPEALGQEIEAMVTTQIEAGTRGDVDASMALYADTVDFLDEGLKSREAIAKAIHKAMHHEPGIDWLLANQDKVPHYYHQLGVKGEL